MAREASVTHYKSNLRDIEFNLFEVLRIQERLGSGPFAEMDEDAARQILREIERVATGPFAASFVEGDRTPLRLDENGDVKLPDGIKASLDAFFEGEWYRLHLPEHLGGYGATPTMNWAATAMFAGANASALLYTAGPFFGVIADQLMTDEQRERWISPWLERHWGATMVLTEPDAGSDVGAGRTTARLAPDGTWHLNGTKRFITNGDFDWPENIIHLVLARAVDADGAPLNGPGTKGLSLFMVPKFWINDDGSLGDRNGVRVAGIEDKMGIKASATCEMVFGDSAVPARGLLVGERHDGIRQMFKVIEYARMLVGVKAIETLSTGYLNAVEYARQRVQGPDLARASDKASPRVAILRHPDVRRSLMMQKSHVEGLRALVLYTADVQDRISAAEHEAASGTGDDALQALRRRNDLLLPLVKGYGSEKSYELLAQSLQVFGGSGYTRDYPIEQYLRDAKIDTLYEGTTAIQALDLFFRKIGRDQGAALSALLEEVHAFVKGDAGNGQLQAERALLGDALEHTGAMLTAMAGFFTSSLMAADPADSAGQIYRIGLNTTSLLYSIAELLIAWLLLRHADVALAAQASGSDDPFYAGKIASARWFATQVLPQFSARREILERTDLGVMELDDSAW